MPDRESKDAIQRNREAWNRLVKQGHRFSRPAKPDDLKDPLKTVDAVGWLGKSIVGKQVLCLAAGGGKHSIIYASAGAKVTVVDLSDEMLKLDLQAARERDLEIETIQASMDALDAIENARFDIVIQPVSTCYLPNIGDVYAEVARVTKPSGLYVSQHKQPTSLQASLRTNDQGHYSILDTYYRDMRVSDAQHPSSLREDGAWEYLHRWEMLIGAMCRAGFVIEDLVEPMHAKPNAARDEFGHRAMYVSPYVRIKARRRTDEPISGDTSRLILPSD